MDKNNKVKFDKRFKMYKPKVQEDFSLDDISDLANSTEEFITEDTDMIKFNQFINEDSDKSLKSKAEKSGMPFGVLKKVYNRGMAAWKTGHRPGTTPEQWGHARVNSFITKSSGTWGKADSDLAAKVRKEEVELDETLSPSEKKLVNQMYDKKGNLTAIGKKVMNHGKKPGDKGYVESIEEKNGLWANIHAKRARGEKMRKKGEKGAPTPEAIKAAQESFDEAYKITKIYNKVTKKDIAAKRSTATYAVHSHDRKYFKEFPNQKDAEKHLKSLGKKEDIDVIMSNLDMVNEVAGAGEQGTDKLVKKYKKDTPNCSD